MFAVHYTVSVCSSHLSLKLVSLSLSLFKLKDHFIKTWMENKRQGKLDNFREERHGEQEERKASPQKQAGIMLEIYM